MSTKEKVLELLYKHDGYVSGEEIARAAGVGRNSVWKAVNSLKEQGYNIVTGAGGYMLCGGVFNEFAIKQYLNREHKIHIYKQETSSNTVAKVLCQGGEAEGSVVVVESQTQGRGRMGRSFISESENGLYMSVILRPSIPADRCVNVTVMCAVAVKEAIESLTDRRCGIKWVNDIYIGEKKCCGILTEASFDFESGSLQYVVVGIGVNLCPPKGGFDKEIEEIACGVYENECPKDFKEKLCAQIINRLFYHYERFEKGEYIKEYKNASIIIGESVEVRVGDTVTYGVAVDIDDNANLIVRDENGETHSFNSGEARVRKQKNV